MNRRTLQKSFTQGYTDGMCRSIKEPISEMHVKTEQGSK